MLYQFLEPINEVRVDASRPDVCIPVNTPAGKQPLILLGHLEDRHKERMQPFVSNFPELEIPWKTVISNYIRQLNKFGYKTLKKEEDQFVVRTLIEFKDKDGNYLGHFECGVLGKFARMIGKPNEFYQGVMSDYKLERGGRILTVETYMCLATTDTNSRIFRGKPDTTSTDVVYKTLIITKEKMRAIQDFSFKLIRGR